MYIYIYTYTHMYIWAEGERSRVHPSEGADGRQAPGDLPRGVCVYIYIYLLIYMVIHIPHICIYIYIYIYIYGGYPLLPLGGAWRFGRGLRRSVGELRQSARRGKGGLRGALWGSSGSCSKKEAADLVGRLA